MVLPFLETFAGGGYWRQYCPESQSDWATPGASSMKISCAGMTELRGPTWPPGSNARPGPLIGPSLGLFNSHVYIHLGILWVRCSLIIDFKIGPVSSVAFGRRFGYRPDVAPSLRNNHPDESFFSSKHSVSPRWNFLRNHPKRNIVCRAYLRAYHEGIRTIRVAFIVGVNGQNVRINFIRNLRQQVFFHEAIPLLRNGTFPRPL